MALELENGFTIIFTLITNYIKEFDLAKGLNGSYGKRLLLIEA